MASELELREAEEDIEGLQAHVARLQAQVDALAGALQALMRVDMRGHELADRLQFSTQGREILDRCRAAIAAAGR